MKFILAAILCVSMGVGSTAQTYPGGTGYSPCESRNFTFRPGPSGLTQSGGQIIKSGDGDGLLQYDDKVSPGEVAAITLTVDDFGAPLDEKDPNRGAFELGVADEAGTGTYFAVSAERKKHALYRSGKLIGYYNASFEAGDQLRLERSKDQLVLYRYEGRKPQTIATIEEVARSSNILQVRLVAPRARMSRSYSIYDCPPYAKLKHQLDASYFELYNHLLRFKFRQQYATPNNASLNIAYKIYDWQRNVVLDGTIPMNYGMNWRQINIGSLPNDTFYTLEIEANKGERYLLRFRTKPSVPYGNQ